jgi:hypothetical protein
VFDRIYCIGIEGVTMRRLFASIITACLLTMAATSAFAETFTVPANKTSVLTFYYVYLESTCSTGNKPEFKVLTQGEHGTVSAKWMAVKLEKARKNCQGAPVHGTAIFYTPKKGFHGVDHVKIAFGKTETAMALPFSSRAYWFKIVVE